ncbi:MAG: YfhO family protein [Tatlockia sp.]|nr:YfhO family protein [Tatlockia sp.]
MPVAKLLYNFPLTHAFRFHTRMYFISSMALVVMFSYAFNYILNQNKQTMLSEIYKILKLGGMVLLLTFVFMYGLIAGVNFFQDSLGKIDGLKINNQPLQTLLQYYHFKNPGLAIPFITFGIGSLLLWLLPFTQIRKVLLFGLGLLCVIDICTVSSSFRHNQLFDYPQIELMNKMKSLLQQTDRMIVSSDNYSFTVSDNASFNYDMQSLDGFVSFDERIISSLSNSTTSLANLQNPLILINLLQFHNDFLSMLGLKYIAIDTKFAKEIIKSYQFPTGHFELLTRFNGKDMHKTPGGIYVLSKKIKIQPNTFYKINFSLENAIKGQLFIDFYGKNYNNREQKIAFVSNKLTKKREFSALINSGDIVPDESYFRIIGMQKDINVENVEIYSSAAMSMPSVYKPLFTSDGFSVYENPKAKKRIYSVTDIRWGGNTDYSEANLLDTAVTDERIRAMPGFGIAEIIKTIYKAGNVKTKISCPTVRCFIVLSESYFPGWKVYVDGKKTKLFKVNDLIMGVIIGKGEHWVRFHYFPTSFLAGICFFLLGLIWVPIWMFRRQKNVNIRI